eukprot:365210-Chlamydomonas_euryale.AAC.3
MLRLDALEARQPVCLPRAAPAVEALRRCRQRAARAVVARAVRALELPRRARVQRMPAPMRVAASTGRIRAIMGAYLDGSWGHAVMEHACLLVHVHARVHMETLCFFAFAQSIGSDHTGVQSRQQCN